MPSGFEKLLTIVIPAYNVREYLEKALESCVIEDMDCIEVLVIVDGSKDGSLELARRYELECPGAFKAIYKENGGYGSVLNLGIEIARGKYFKVLDGDDWFDRTSLQKLVALIPSINDDLIGLQYRCVYQGDGRSVVVDEVKAPSAGSFPVAGLFDSPAMIHSFAYKTDVLRQVGPLPEKCLYTDTIFSSFAIDLSSSVYYLPLPVYNYRLDRPGQSVELSSRANHLDDVERVLGFLLKRFDEGVPSGSMVAMQCYSVAEGHYKTIYKVCGGDRMLVKRLNQQVKSHDSFYHFLLERSRVARLSSIGNGLFAPILSLLSSKM